MRISPASPPPRVRPAGSRDRARIRAAAGHDRRPRNGEPRSPRCCIATLKAHEESGLRSALRVTPTDIRDQGRAAQLRAPGRPVGPSRRSLRAVHRDAGADILPSSRSAARRSTTSPGVRRHPRHRLRAGGLAPRDMAWLWDADRGLCAHGTAAAPGGDTACGFANTAMQLAHQKMLPEVLAAVVARCVRGAQPGGFRAQGRSALRRTAPTKAR